MQWKYVFSNNTTVYVCKISNSLHPFCFWMKGTSCSYTTVLLLYYTTLLLLYCCTDTTVFFCSEFTLENICSGVNFSGKMFAVNFICGSLFLQIAGKIAKNWTRTNFVPHRRLNLSSVGITLSFDRTCNREYSFFFWNLPRLKYSLPQGNLRNPLVSLHLCITAPRSNCWWKGDHHQLQTELFCFSFACSYHELNLVLAVLQKLCLLFPL